MERAEIRELGERTWDCSGEIIEGKVEEGEIFEGAEEAWERAREIVPAEVEGFEVAEIGYGGLDGSVEIWQLVEHEGL